MPKDFTEDSEHGPLSVLVSAIKTNSQVLINCRNNRKLLGRVKAFDRHLNLLLENVKEVWTDRNSQNESKTPPSNKDRFISKLFLRGDSIILVLKNPKWVPYDYESRTYIFLKRFSLFFSYSCVCWSLVNRVAETDNKKMNPWYLHGYKMHLCEYSYLYCIK